MQNHKPYWRVALERGLIGGGIVVLISLIGMVEVFKDRDIIGGVISMGLTLILGAIFIFSYGTVNLADGNRTKALYGGALTGAVSSLIAAFMVWVSALESLNLRAVFINASPPLVEVLTFGQELFPGMFLLILTGSVIGLIAGSLEFIAPYLRKAIIQMTMIVVLAGLLAELLRLIVVQWGDVQYAFLWLFGKKGLSIPGTIFIAGLVLSLGIYSHIRSEKAAKTTVVVDPRKQSQRRIITLGVMSAILLVLPPIFGIYVSEVLDQVGLFILMGLGLNIVVGFAGLLDLGYVAFYAIGAYTMGVLTSPELASNPLTWWEALPLAVVVATFAGFLLGIPVLRMRGDYLAIVTLGFGEIIRLLAGSDLLKPFIGGAQGIQRIAKPTIGTFVFNDQIKLFYIILIGCLIAAFISVRLRDSRLGRSWMAMREDEDVAEAMGINLISIKLLAFATGAAFSGLSGAIFAAKIGSAYPHSFHLLVSINVLSLIIVGGMGSIPGVVVGSLALVGLPELLREFGEFRLLVYGALLVWMMLNRPEGLWPEEAHKRELHSDDFSPTEVQA